MTHKPSVGRPEDDPATVNYLEVCRLRALLCDMEAAKNDYATIAFERGKEIDRLTQALELRPWTEQESDGMAEAFSLASRKHGYREALFAVGAWLLRHRAAAASAPAG